LSQLLGLVGLCLAFFLSASAKPPESLKLDLDNARSFAASRKGGSARVSVASDSRGRGKNMKGVTHDEKDTVAVEVGSKRFTVEVTKLSATTGTLKIVSTEEGLDADELAEVGALASDVFAHAPEAANERAGLGAQVLTYLSRAPPGWAIKSREMNLTIGRADHDIKGAGHPKGDDSPQRRSHTCSDPYLGSLAYPNNNEPNCPYWGSHTEADDGALCMCPYGGGGTWTAWYDTGTSPHQIDWVRYHGSDTNQCTGRCGAGCNWLDKEAFWDCFEHDSCVDHVGGSSLGGNADCGDEFDHAADDYIVSYGWGCC